MATKMKKTLSLTLALIMVLGMLPLTAFAADFENQVGSYIEYDAEGATTGKQLTAEEATKTLEDGKLTMSKSIKQTAKDAFDITLLVTTAEDLENIPLSQDAAVVLLIDASASMYDNMEGTGNVRYSNGEWKYDTAVADQRITKAKAAAVSFVESFAKDADGTSASGKRMVAVGAFNSDAWRVQNWIDANAETSGEANRTTIETALNQIELGSSTNPDAGLQLAYNMLGHNDVNTIASKFVILLTDGEPNAKKYTGGIGNNSEEYVGGKTGLDEKDAAAAAGATAAALKQDKKATLYTLAFATADRKCYEGDVCKHCNQDYDVHGRRVYLCEHCMETENAHVALCKNCGLPEEKHGGWTGTKCPDLSAKYYDPKMYCTNSLDVTTGEYAKEYSEKKFYPCKNTNPQTYYNDTVTVGDWLSSIASKDCYKNAAIDGDIVIQFDEINEQIRKLLQAWQVTDPMGQYIGYVGLKNDQEKNSVTFKDNTLNWNLWDSKAEEGKDTADNKTYTYTLTYSVTLDTAAQGFEENKFYATNGATKLVYVVNALNEDGTLNPTAPQSTNYFNVPSVKGEIPTLNYSIEYYWQENAVAGDFTNYTMHDESKNLPAKMHTEVKLDVVDKGYQDKYNEDNYHWVKSDPATVTLNEDGKVLRVYYNHDMVNIDVEHWLKTDKYAADGTFTEGEYVKLPESSNAISVPKGSNYTETKLSDDASKNYTFVEKDSTSASLANIQGDEAIKLYYKTVEDAREDTTVEVYHQIDQMVWTLVAGDNGDTHYELKRNVGKPSLQKTDTNVKAHATYTESTALEGVTFESAKLEQSDKTTDLQAKDGSVQFTTAPKGNKLTLVFVSTPATPPVDTEATIQVTHKYTKDVTTIVDGAVVRDQVAHEDIVECYPVSGKWYSGEKHTVTASQATPEGGTDTYQLPEVTSKQVVLVPGQNNVTFEYTLTSAPAETTATINYVYCTLHEITNPATGETISEEDTSKRVENAESVKNLLVGQYVPIQPDSNVPAGNYQLVETAPVDYQEVPAAADGSTVITLTYELQGVVDDRTEATVNVTHSYFVNMETVKEGKPDTVTSPDGVEETTVVTGKVGEKMFPNGAEGLLKLEHNGHIYTRLDTSSLDGNFKLSNPDIGLTYIRNDSDRVEIGYHVNYTYYDWQMTVQDGVAGYYEGESKGRNDTISTSTDVTSTHEKPLYVGMNITLADGAKTDYEAQNDNSDTAQLLKATPEGGENPNVYNFTFVKKTPLAPATVTVKHSYVLTTISEIGESTTATPVVKSGTATPDSTLLHKDVAVSTVAVKDGYTLISVTGTNATGEAVTYTADKDGKVSFLATGADTVVFNYTKTDDLSADNKAHYTINHYYRVLDWNETTSKAYGDPITTAYGDSFGSVHQSGSVDLKLVDGKPTYSFDKVEYTGAGSCVTVGATSTMQLGKGENTLNFYYTKTVDTRPEVSVIVNHVYRVTDPNAPGGFVQEAVVSESKDAKAPGQYTAEQEPNRTDGDKTINYAFVESDHKDCKLDVIVDGNNVINLYYTRAYGEGDLFDVHGMKEYVGIDESQYPTTTIYLKQNGEIMYSALVTGREFTFRDVRPGVYDLGESADLSGYTYTAKYELVSHATTMALEQNESAVVVSQITVNKALDGYLRITNTYTSNPTPPPTPGTTYYGITVKYVDEAGKELSAAHTERHYAGYSYDVTDKTTLQIADYTIKSVTGDTLAGRLNGDKVITVVYAPVVVIPDEPVPEGGKPGEVILPDVEPPKTDLPEELEDGAVPLDAAPKTGDTATLWTTLMAVSGFGLAALAIFKGKKKEEDSAE